MKSHHYPLIMGAVLIAPHITPSVSIGLGCVYLIVGLINNYINKGE
jgi:hypothetical protein